LNCFASLGRVSWLLLTANAPNSQDRDAFVPAKMPQNFLEAAPFERVQKVVQEQQMLKQYYHEKGLLSTDRGARTKAATLCKLQMLNDLNEY
jgi:hypothetical protein